VSLLSSSSDTWTYVRQHTLAGASLVDVVVDRRATSIGVDAVEKGEESDLDGLHVRRWSALQLVDTELCLPARDDQGRFDVAPATTGTVDVTLGPPDTGTTIASRLLAASLDRADEHGLLALRAEPLSAGTWSGFELEQGAATDLLRLSRDGKTYEASTPHLTPATPLSFALEGESSFLVSFPALHFVNRADAADVLELDGLTLRWQLSHLVPQLQPPSP
jgi:hypothetical protein